jgi:hypothetical protein
MVLLCCCGTLVCIFTIFGLALDFVQGRLFIFLAYSLTFLRLGLIRLRSGSRTRLYPLLSLTFCSGWVGYKKSPGGRRPSRAAREIFSRGSSESESCVVHLVTGGAVTTGSPESVGAVTIAVVGSTTVIGDSVVGLAT